MPPIVTLLVDAERVRKAIAAIGTDAPKAIMRALNRTASTAKTQAVRAIAADLGIGQKRIRENVSLRKAYPARLVASVEARPGGAGIAFGQSKSERRGRIQLYEFKARGPVPSRGKGGGVRYQLPGGRGVAPHAFIVTMKSGHVGVFQRLPGTQMPSARVKRQKIVELYGPSVPHVFANKQIMAAMKISAEQNLIKNLISAVNGLVKTGAVPGGDGTEGTE